jgi:hypothetical protein
LAEMLLALAQPGELTVALLKLLQLLLLSR